MYPYTVFYREHLVKNNAFEIPPPPFFFYRDDTWMVTYMFKKYFKKIYLQARSNRNDTQYWTINKFQNGTDFEKDNNDKDYDCSLNNLSNFFVSVQFIILICGILVCTYVQ